LALSAELRGPIFLCHEKAGPETEILGVLNRLQDLSFVNDRSDPLLKNWKRGAILEMSIPELL
jgi:hypothetical protein